VDTNHPLIDPHKDETDTASQNELLFGSVISSATSDTCSVVLEETTYESNSDGQSISSEQVKPVSVQNLSLLERTESIDYTDYLYEAAYEFSSAVMAETNSKYKEAFDLYKNGIDKLLYGVKSDKDDSRRKIVKSKISKYLEHAEEIFQKHILNCRDDLFSNVELGGGLTLDNSEVKNLERPLNYLARYKVVNILSGLMQVLDVTTKICYIMKVIIVWLKCKFIFLMFFAFFSAN
jgi:ribosomal protein S6 kinase-like